MEFENELVRAFFNESLYSIVALSGEPLDDETVSSVLSLTERVLALDVHFRTLWDLRLVAVPPLSVVVRCIRWAWQHKRALDNLNDKMLILASPNALLLRMINMVLKSFGPRCPTSVTADETAGREWLSGNQTQPIHNM